MQRSASRYGKAKKYKKVIVAEIDRAGIEALEKGLKKLSKLQLRQLDSTRRDMTMKTLERLQTAIGEAINSLGALGKNANSEVEQ